MTSTSAWRILLALLLALAFVATAYAEDDPDAEVIKKLNALGLEAKKEGNGPLKLGLIYREKLNSETLALLKQLKAKVSICICDCKLTKSDGELLDGCECIRDLHFLHCSFDPASPFFVSKLPRLDSLSISNPKAMNDDALKGFATLSTVKMLYISGAKINGEGLGHLRSDSLETIMIDDCRLTDDGVKTIKNFKKLQMILLTDCPCGDGMRDALSDLKDLRGVVLDGTKLADAGLRKLIRPSLTLISVKNTKVTRDFVEELKVICSDLHITR